MPRTIYVPTGEVRSPRIGEFFAPIMTEHNPVIHCECHRRAIDGVRVELCYVYGIGDEVEIYQEVTINA